MSSLIGYGDQVKSPLLSEQESSLFMQVPQVLTFPSWVGISGLLSAVRTAPPSGI